ncbi:biotin--[acetyl-CoA-carboxylase] ligase [Candidatus Puniceispirillum sp.]|nr:biotin--[acetyl-CoA-carboxylase] ligase [Candidatus Puniceispirillum sp.]
MVHPLICSITIEQSATSTSDLAKQAAAKGAPSGSGFLAIEQTAGRGRQGRQWSSQKGGMYLSVLLRPTVKKKYWFALSFVASLAALDTVRHQLARHFDNQHMPQTGLKWPNDVILSGGKIAGILLESEGSTLIVGSGINIAPVQPLVGRGINPEVLSDQVVEPASLADIWPQAAGVLPTPHQLARCFMKQLDYWYGKFEHSGFAPIRDAWLGNALFLGKAISVWNGTKKISGVFHDLGLDGALLLLDDLGHTHHITTGDVQLLDN